MQQPAPSQLRIHLDQSVTALNGGLFVSPGYGIHPTRSISSWELILVKSGELHMFEEQQDFHLQTGDCLILFPERKHGGSCDYKSDLSFYWIHFLLEPSSPNEGDALILPQWSSLKNPDRMGEFFRFALANQQLGIDDQLQASLLVQLMLSEIALSGRTEEAGALPLVEQARTFIKIHFRHDISTSAVAQSLQCNPDYLGRIFRTATGTTLTEAINQQRIHHACHLLMDTVLHVDEIIAESGFRDPAYFRRIFKRLNGMSPTAYRKLFSKVHINIR